MMKLLDPFVRASTREFKQATKQVPNYRWRDWLHGYIYARWPYRYIAIATGENWLTQLISVFGGFLSRAFIDSRGTSTARAFADSYHGKVVPVEEARRLVTIQQDVNLPDLERVIPYQSARDIVLRNPDHITVLECPCRSARKEPCLPLDVCLIVGEPFAGFVLEHHPTRARQISPAEAESILQAEHERGHVSHAFFKDAMLGRFYAICNCCSCCCGAMQAHQNGTPMLASSGYVARVDADLCEGCGLCMDMCPFGAISLDEERGADINWNECMGCGVCTDQCPVAAIELVLDEEKGEPLEIRRLIEEASRCA